MKIKEKQLKKENQIIHRILTDTHDDGYEYVNECLSEHEDETAEDALKKVNAIREFLGDEPMTIKELKKELIVENL